MAMTSKIIPPPVGGMMTQSNLINTKMQFALSLINWIPDVNAVKSRKGYKYHQKISGTTGPFLSLIPFSGGTNNAAHNFLFGATTNGLYKIQVNATDNPLKLIDGGNANGWTGAIMSVEGAIYMRLTDGDSKDYLYNDNYPDRIERITIPPPGGASWIYAHHGRFYFGRKNSLDFYYLPTAYLKATDVKDYTKFPLGQFLNKGGFLVAMHSWSMDTGSGMHDFAVFTSSRGQSCIYHGSNPGDQNAWSLLGVFNHGRPLSKRCFLRSGADLLLWTTDGLISIQSMINKKEEALGYAEMSSRVATTLEKDVMKSSGFGFDICLFPADFLVICTIPFGTKSKQYVFNMLTGAVSIFEGIDIYCLAEIEDKLFAGAREATVDKNGNACYGIYQMNTGRTDNGKDIELEVKHAFSFLGDATRTKKISHAEIHMEASAEPHIKFEILTDLNPEGRIATIPAPIAEAISLWDSSLWGNGEKTPVSPDAPLTPTPPPPPPEPQIGRWGRTHKVYNIYRGIRKICRSASINIRSASRDSPMTLHGTTLYFSYTTKTTPREPSFL